MIKIDESTTYGEFKKLIETHQCKIVLKDHRVFYYDPGDVPSMYIFTNADKVEILDSKRTNIADKAKKIIYGDREQTYGEPGKNIQSTADMWGTYLGVPITQGDVCNMMCLLKIARLKNTPGHEDSMVDLVGYTLLQERILNKV